MSAARETYLGDGLYVSFNGFGFILRAPREGGDHWIVLEPSIVHAFAEYVERIMQEPDREQGDPS
jgi:hypothetical protein